MLQGATAIRTEQKTARHVEAEGAAAKGQRGLPCARWPVRSASRVSTARTIETPKVPWRRVQLTASGDV